MSELDNMIQLHILSQIKLLQGMQGFNAWVSEHIQILELKLVDMDALSCSLEHHLLVQDLRRTKSRVAKLFSTHRETRGVVILPSRWIHSVK